MTEPTNAEEYAICQRRGHQSDRTLATIPPKFVCKWCGTVYWYASEIREERPSK